MATGHDRVPRYAPQPLTTSFANASPQEILAIPTAQQRNQTTKNYRRGKTVVLTSTPYKIELEEREQLKRTKKCSNPNDPKLKKNSKKQKTQKAPSGVENTDEDSMCLYCLDVNHTYLKSSEGWVACQLCGRWAHTACAGVDDDNTEEIHICLYCDAKEIRTPYCPYPWGTMGFSLQFQKM